MAAKKEEKKITNDVFTTVKATTVVCICFKREKYNKDNFLNETSTTAGRATVCSTSYCVDREKRMLLCATVYNTAAQTKTDTAADTKQ